MLELLPSPAEAIRKPLENVVGRVLERGAVQPPWIAVDDGGGEWLVLVSGRSPAERARGVLATAGDEALVAALRLGVGGAAPLPPSSRSFEEALAAAATSKAGGELCKPEVAALITGGRRFTVWTFGNLGFWRHQFGRAVLASLLSDLAVVLEVPPAIIAWPALLVTDRARRAVAAAWKECTRDRWAPTQGLKATDVKPGDEDAVTAAYRSLLEAGVAGERLLRTPRAAPVHELPSGRLVGWWAPMEANPGSRGWLATPAWNGPSRCSWELRGGEQVSRVEEALTSAELMRARGIAAVRIPGWAVRDLRPGTPAGLLASRLADRAARSGLPLWIPNLEPDALHFALSLPGTLWVDGPAVPREGEWIKR